MLASTIKESLETKMAKCSEVCQTVAKLIDDEYESKMLFPKRINIRKNNCNCVKCTHFSAII